MSRYASDQKSFLTARPESGMPVVNGHNRIIDEGAGPALESTRAADVARSVTRSA